MRKKIIATLGPSSLTKDVVQKMDSNGVDLFRINLSHTKASDFNKLVLKIRNWTQKPICPDTEGSQLRLGYFSESKEEIEVFDNEIFELVSCRSNFAQGKIPLNVDNPAKVLQVGDLLEIDFNQVSAQIIEIKKESVLAKILCGGKVGQNKGIKVDRSLELPTFTKKDIEVFKIANQLKLSTIFLSFCSNSTDVVAIRKYFDYHVDIISKVESGSALQNLSDICKESDGILIDRGDLSRDVSIEKIAFAQNYIIKESLKQKVPVFVATNLVESMIQNKEPTRAEINDIISILFSGASGLVLAAETAIGKYPSLCVEFVNRLILEFESGFPKDSVDYLLSDSIGNLIRPHGGSLIQQFENIKNINFDDYIEISVDEKVESDIIQICEGTYSPLTQFMDVESVESVLNNNCLENGSVWPIPIIFQINHKTTNQNKYLIKRKKDKKIFALIKNCKFERIDDLKNNWALKWFGTDSLDHPGVKNFIKGPDLILSGKPFLIENYYSKLKRKGEVSPRQSRKIFKKKGWKNIVGFHTRNVIHKGHEYIQKKALEKVSADAIFISPVSGQKKPGDFNSDIIIRCYNALIKDNIYKTYGAFIGPFNTFSRYSGPREAVFTALCRQNYGCNYFIVGRDHTGVGNYYSNNESKDIFDLLNIDIKILPFDIAYFLPKENIITDSPVEDTLSKNIKEISGSEIRKYLKNNMDIPSYLVRPIVKKILIEKYNKGEEYVFEETN